MPFALKYENNKVTSSRLYHIWNGMRQRCGNENSKDYARYGGRGIEVCKEWLYDFLEFESWAKNNGYDDALSIDRIDFDGGYNPNNCRWADSKIQANNRSTNTRITYNGETKNLCEWAEEFGLTKDTIIGRLDLGWDIEKALETPPNGTKFKYISYEGKDYTLKELSNTFGIPYGCVKYRNKIGMTGEEIVNTPVNHSNKLRKQQQ